MNGKRICLWRQRGAATLIAAVLLMSVVAVALVIGLLNANTNITDTSLQADGVEALFIAESGLENVIDRFDNGTACGTLALGPIGVGRGDFTINNGTNAGLPAIQCRVQVTGRIGQSDTSRTIEAVITRATAGGTVNLVNPGFEAGGCPPGPDNWTVAATWTANPCNALVNNPPGTNDSRVLYSRVTEGGTANFNSTTAFQTINCVTGPGGNTTFNVSWDFRYDESPTAGGQKTGIVFVRLLDVGGTSYPAFPGASVSYTTDGGWATSTTTITVPANVTLQFFDIRLFTFRRATVELWADNFALTLASGPGCLTPAQALTWGGVARP